MATTIEAYPLERRKILKKTVAFTVYLWIFFFVVPFWLQVFFWTEGGPLVFIPIDLFFVIMPFVWWVYQREYYKRYFYDVRNDFLAIKKGVITPNETVLPYDKLQDVYVDQDVFDRIFKLYDVHVSTATYMSGVQAHIDGVNQQNSQIIRELILDQIRKFHKA